LPGFYFFSIPKLETQIKPSFHFGSRVFLEMSTGFPWKVSGIFSAAMPPLSFSWVNGEKARS
jgi:hypothetical protein